MQDDVTPGPDSGLDAPQETVGFISFLFILNVVFFFKKRKKKPQQHQLLMLDFVVFLQSKMFVADISVEQSGKINTSITRTLYKHGSSNVTRDI